ncbi:MAG: BMP family ABC transporter substrate-binding protein [Christensenellales bacterium]
MEKTPAEFGQEIERIWSEFVVAAANKPAALLSQPTEGKPGFLQSVWHRPPQKVRCAFLYNRSPQDSGWSYWHELGRKALEDTFGSRVETVCCECVAQEDAQEVIERFIEDGYDVIFAASPVFLDACIRQCAIHPNAKILNCSLLASYHNVRSYYLRVYEAKFVLRDCRRPVGKRRNRLHRGLPHLRHAHVDQCLRPRRRWSTRAPKSCWNGPLPGHSPEAALARAACHHLQPRHQRAASGIARVRPVSRAGRRDRQPRHADLELGQAVRGHRPQHPDRRGRRGRAQRRPRHELLHGHVHRRD